MQETQAAEPGRAPSPGAVPALLRALVDDAGLFPPERLPMPEALRRHRDDAAAAHPVLTHRFLCPASRLGEMRGVLDEGDAVRLGLIADTGPDGLAPALAEAAAEPRLTLDIVEIPCPADDDPAGAVRGTVEALAVLPASVAAYVEVARVPGWADGLSALASAGAGSGEGGPGEGGPGGTRPGRGRPGAKVRCGGGRADLFPSVEELAGFVHACVREQLPFKATAGLHHAVRYRDEETGFVHHGFLNLLLGVCRAVDGATAGDIAEVLRTAEGAVLAAEASRVPAERAIRARELLVSYGSCSTSEPLEDIAALGLAGAAA